MYRIIIIGLCLITGFNMIEAQDLYQPRNVKDAYKKIPAHQIVNQVPVTGRITAVMIVALLPPRPTESLRELKRSLISITARIHRKALL